MCIVLCMDTDVWSYVCIRMPYPFSSKETYSCMWTLDFYFDTEYRTPYVKFSYVFRRISSVSSVFHRNAGYYSYLISINATVLRKSRGLESLFCLNYSVLSHSFGSSFIAVSSWNAAVTNGLKLADSCVERQGESCRVCIRGRMKPCPLEWNRWPTIWAEVDVSS